MGSFEWVLLVSLIHVRVGSGQYDTTSYNTTLDAQPTSMGHPNLANNQLLEYAKSVRNPPVATSSYGVPVDNLLDSLTAGPRGPILLQDFTFVDATRSINREQIPERIVHAKGAGAIGNLAITGDITRYSSATVFQPGTVWNVTTRFSRISGELGSQDTRRDTRGFATKIYTNRGIWDLVSNNSPIFFIRDPTMFNILVHAIMRNPATHLYDPNAQWDFFSRVPQVVPQLLIQFSDYGLPLSYRYMDGFSIHAFTLVNSAGNVSYGKFRWRSNQGVKFMSSNQANLLASTNPDFFIQDLYNAIGSGDYPTWNLTAQIVTPEQLEEFPFYPFDATKDWNTTLFPEIPVGILTLNQNPKNYFVEVENVGFDPGRLVPGIQPTVDRLLQGRMFSYGDAQTYRLGVNGYSLLRNTPENRVSNYLRDGPGDYGTNQGGAVNYYPNSFNGPVPFPEDKLAPYRVSGVAGRFSTQNDDNFSQGIAFYETLSPDHQNRTIENLAASISTAYPFIQARALQTLCNIGVDFCQKLSAALHMNVPSTTSASPLTRANPALQTTQGY